MNSNISHSLSHLLSQDVDAIRATIEQLGDVDSVESIGILRGLLERHAEIRVRSAVALAFRKSRRSEVVSYLFDAIERPENYRYRGTFLYALEPHDCKTHISTVASLVGDRSFEVRQHALILLEAIQPPVSPEVLAEARTIMSAAKLKLNGEPEEEEVEVGLQMLDALE